MIDFFNIILTIEIFDTIDEIIYLLTTDSAITGLVRVNWVNSAPYMTKLSGDT